MQNVLCSCFILVSRPLSYQKRVVTNQLRMTTTASSFLFSFFFVSLFLFPSNHMENTKCVRFKQEAETLFLARGRKQRAKYAVGPLRRRINPCSLHGTLETTPTDDVTVGMFYFRVCLVRPHLLPQRRCSKPCCS